LTVTGGTLNIMNHNIGSTTAPLSAINLTGGTLPNAALIAGKAISLGGTGGGTAISGTPVFYGPATISNTFAPGGSIGTDTFDGNGSSGAALTLSSGATLAYELNNPLLSDKIALINGAAGDIVFNSNTINFTDLSGGSLADGQYTLFTADVASAYAGLTEDGSGFITGGLAIGTGLGAYNSSLQQVGNNIVLNVSAVPEPTSAAVLGISAVAAGLASGRGPRRRRFAAV
jgi:hypothetical protein